MNVYQIIEDRIKELKAIKQYTESTTAIINKIVELEIVDSRIEELNDLLDKICK